MACLLAGMSLALFNAVREVARVTGDIRPGYLLPWAYKAIVGSAILGFAFLVARRLSASRAPRSLLAVTLVAVLASWAACEWTKAHLRVVRILATQDCLREATAEDREAACKAMSSLSKYLSDPS